MKLSIIIVNYNVQNFLEQCLHSVKAACKDIDAEIFVVDNQSVDGSVGMLKSKFSEVHLIENAENVGFSKANNQAIRLAKGEYVLLLNPDTIVEVDTFSKCLAFMDAHPEAGGLGVKMIDGKGRYLPESKRGLPTPEVSFYKISGLIKLFPRSKRFARYYMGNLNENETHSIDVLAGAFMLLRKSVLDKIGLLDEQFFMYGEDIDLSYRICLAGYKNYYFPETRIIHYKGESTKKGSINYVVVFYKAMQIFMEKHFANRQSRLFSVLITCAIWLRAALSVVKRAFRKIAFPLFDFTVLYAVSFGLVQFWERFYFQNPSYYPEIFTNQILPAYIALWVCGMLAFKAYQTPIRFLQIWKGIGVGTLAILALYALVSPQFHFSRALILMGALSSLLIVSLSRYLLALTGMKAFRLYTRKNKIYALIGSEDECLRISKLLRKTDNNLQIIFVNAGRQTEKDNFFVGNINELSEIIRIQKVNELVFCTKNIAVKEVISRISELKVSSQIDIKIAPPDSDFLIGSNAVQILD